MDTNDEALPKNIVDLCETINTASGGNSHADILTALALFLHIMTDGDDELIEHCVDRIRDIAVNIYAEPLQ